MQTLKNRAIILSKTKYGESDLILKLLTADGQVFSAIAKSALKSRKRFGGGVLEPTHFVAVTYSQAHEESERMALLTEASLLDGFPKLRTDYDRIEMAFHFLRWAATFAREGDAHKELFDLLGHTLKSLETHENLRVLKMIFELKVLQLQGVLPNDPDFFPFLRRSVRDISLHEVNDSDLASVQLKIDWVKSQYI